MRIDYLAAYHIKIPLKTPFRISVGQINEKEGVVFECRGDGLTAWGEAAVDRVPFYSHETVGSVLDMFECVLAPQMLSRSWDTPEELNDAFEAHRGNNFAKAGLEIAFWDMLGKARGQSVSRLLGGTRKVVETGPSIGIKSTPDKTIDAIRYCISLGRRRIKIKVCPGFDNQYLDAIRAEFPTITLMVDANNAYSPDDFDKIASWDKYNLLMLEQPLNESDIYFHSLLRKRIHTPVCLDESIHTEHDMRCAIALQSADIINIKVCRVGGLLKAKRIHDICQSAGIPNWIGSRVGTGIAGAARIAAASLPNCTFPTDAALAGGLYMADDIITEPLPVHDGFLVTVPQKNGLGIDVDREKLSRYTVRKLEIKA